MDSMISNAAFDNGLTISVPVLERAAGKRPYAVCDFFESHIRGLVPPPALVNKRNRMKAS